jgi:hypothetical protein
MNRLILIPLLIFLACGPNAEERARIQKEREDSIRVATEQMTKVRFEKGLALKEDIRNVEAILEGQSNRLSFFKGELEVQKDKLNTIKQPQFLRTPAEKEQQIRAQVLVIEQAENEIKNLRDEIVKTEEKLKNLKQEVKEYE